MEDKMHPTSLNFRAQIASLAYKACQACLSDDIYIPILYYLPLEKYIILMT